MSEKLSSRITLDHEEIKGWIENKGGKPARVKSTGEDAGLLRVDFIEGDKREEALEELSWQDFFDEFDSKRLAFLYEEGESRFCKFIKRD